jgi:hypothetical protein
MKKISKIFLLTAVLSLLAVALGFLTTSPAPAQAPPPSVPVTVTNTTARAVPTTAVGTTSVSGSVTALQGPTPWLVRAVQDSPWRVSNPLNASNAPVPLLVQGEGEPFTLNTSCNQPTASGTPTPCEPGFPGQPNITLPTGSGAFVGTVVIDFVSGACSGLVTSTIPTFPLQVFGPNISNPAGQQNFGVFNFTGVPLSGSSLNPGIPGSNISWFAQQTRIYAQPGSSAVLLMGENTGCSFSLSGHLIPY